MLILFLIIAIIICIIQIFNEVKYIRDYKNDDIIIVYETIEALESEDRSTRIMHTDYGEYRIVANNYSLKEFGELYDNIKNNFNGKYCEIEYYRSSKYVKRIKIFGDK